MNYVSYDKMKEVINFLNPILDNFLSIGDYYDDSGKIVGHYLVIDCELETDELDEEDEKYNG